MEETTYFLSPTKQVGCLWSAAVTAQCTTNKHKFPLAKGLDIYWATGLLKQIDLISQHLGRPSQSIWKSQIGIRTYKFIYMFSHFFLQFGTHFIDKNKLQFDKERPHYQPNRVNLFYIWAHLFDAPLNSRLVKTWPAFGCTGSDTTSVRMATHLSRSAINLQPNKLGPNCNTKFTKYLSTEALV